MDISNQIFEPRHRIMQPEFEDLCYGTDLRDGMIVLLEETSMKGDPEHVFSEYDEQRLLENNRWCEVNRLAVRPREGTAPLITFIGVYADGTKFSRTYDASYCWVVKKDTELKFDEET